jgi:hypothetical protein
MKKGEIRDFSVGGGIGDGDNGNGKRTKKKVDGQRKWKPGKEVQRGT